jgi:hypothetical protein
MSPVEPIDIKYPVIRRNLLCIKSLESLDLADQWLYGLCKPVVRALVSLCSDLKSKDFILSELIAVRDNMDFNAVSSVLDSYDSLKSLPGRTSRYYEALLGVTSYYQHSQGGRGKYNEKKIASAFQTCSLSITLSELPLWLENPELHKKKGIFTLAGLNSQEKRILRTTPWNWIGNRDESTDVGTILSGEKTIVLAEIKNRIDSGGTAARREIWTSQKFGIIADYLLRNEKLYAKDDDEFSLAELFKFFGFQSLELYIGILFDKGDRPATIKADKREGFYSSSKEGFAYLREKVGASGKVTIINEDLDNLQIELSLSAPDLKLRVGALYGDDITKKLFRKDFPVSDLLLLGYDDIWLAQLTAIDERTSLLKYGRNYLTTFKELLRSDKELRLLYDRLIASEYNNEAELNNLIAYLMRKYQALFDDTLKTADKPKDEYLADVIQFLSAGEA